MAFKINVNGVDRVGSVLGSDGLRHHRRPPRRDLVDTPVRALYVAWFRVKESLMLSASDIFLGWASAAATFTFRQLRDGKVSGRRSIRSRSLAYLRRNCVPGP